MKKRNFNRVECDKTQLVMFKDQSLSGGEGSGNYLPVNINLDEIAVETQDWVDGGPLVDILDEFISNSCGEFLQLQTNDNKILTFTWNSLTEGSSQYVGLNCYDSAKYYSWYLRVEVDAETGMIHITGIKFIGTHTFLH